VKRVLGFLLVLACGASAAPARADGSATEANMASGFIRKNWDMSAVVLNSGTAPITLPRVWTMALESSHDYFTADMRNIVLAPGEARLVHGLIHQFQGSGHYHTQVRFGKPLDHHAGGLQYFGVVTDDQGRIKQVLGPAVHSSKPTTPAPPALPNHKYPFGYSVSGYETYKGYRALAIIKNGPAENKIDVKTRAFELPSGSACEACDVFYQDLGTLKPNEVRVLKIDNKVIEWAHHFMVTLTMSVRNGAHWQILYQDDNGYTYGVQDKYIYSGSGLPPTVQDARPAIGLLSPADNQVAASLTPTLSWQTYTSTPQPTGANLIAYTLKVSTVSDLGLFEQAPTVVQISTTATSYAVPAGKLLAGTTYYWRVRYEVTLPGIPNLAPPTVSKWRSNWSQRKLITPP
jgi:hypothetical protein